MKSQNRRQFLKFSGLSAAAAIATAGCSGAANQSQNSLPTPSEKRKLNRLKLGLASYTTRKLSLDQTIKIAQRTQLKYLALKDFHLPMDSSAEQCAAVAQKVKDADLILYGGGVIYMKTEAEVNRAFDYAQAAGMDTIIGVPGHELLGLVEQKVKKYNIKVAIHNHGPGDKLYPTPAGAYEKIKHLDSRLGLCIDIGHTTRSGLNPAVEALKFADRLHDIHIKDVSAATQKGQTLELGRGVIDIPQFLRALLKINYSNRVSFEYEKDADDPLPGLAESVGYARGVLTVI
ncbi:MAG: sugar phosphate isomerase/epimerase [Sedimentisphaerales bacterium]|nr:sugar phosphate isomerase/epimerase [Sedimentisphaerales bacterium]